MTNKFLFAQYKGPAGYDTDKTRFLQFEKNNLLKIGKYYKVKHFRTVNSITKVVLEQIDEKLNCSAFDFYNITLDAQNKPINKEKYDILKKQQPIIDNVK